MKRLGKNQAAFLEAVRSSGSYYANCGWTWGNVSQSRALAESLTRKGLLVKTKEPKMGAFGQVEYDVWRAAK
jgi:hypothetical protein